MNKILIRRDNLLIFFISIVSIFLLYIYLKNIDIMQNYMEIMMPCIFSFFILEIICLCLIKKVAYYDFGLWFVVLSNFFMFGRFISYNFSLEDNLFISEKIYTNYDMLKSTYFLILVIFLFSLGYCFSYKKCIRETKRRSNLDYRLLGVVLFIIGAPFRIYTDLVTIAYLSEVNSYAAFSDFAVPGIFYSIGALAIPGIICMIYTFKSKSKKIFILFTILYLVTTMILTGSRKQQIFDILALVLFYSVLSSTKIDIKKFIGMGMIGYIFLDLIYIIREYRTNLAIIPQEFMNSLGSFKVISKLIGETLGEIGIIFYSVVNIVHCVPNQFDYQYGTTFLRTLPSFLPVNTFVGDFFELASSTNVINKYMNMPAGSSMFGDLFWNFGFIFGLIASFLFGVFFSKLFNKFNDTETINKGVSPYYFVYFSILMVLVRAEFIDCWRTIVYFLIIDFLLKIILKTKGRYGDLVHNRLN